MGFTEVSKNFGLAAYGNNGAYPYPSAYGTVAGSTVSGAGGTGTAYRTYGVTTDPKKSGLQAVFEENSIPSIQLGTYLICYQ